MTCEATAGVADTLLLGGWQDGVAPKVSISRKIVKPIYGMDISHSALITLLLCVRVGMCANGGSGFLT